MLRDLMGNFSSPPAAGSSLQQAGGDTVLLVSPVVGVVSLGQEDSTAHESVQVTLQSAAPQMVQGQEAGRAQCIPVANFAAPPPEDATCIAGCCIDGACRCRLGYSGERCEHQVRCAIVPRGETLFDVGTYCVTEPLTAAGEYVRCKCDRMGIIALGRFRIAPATNLIKLDGGILTAVELVVGRGMALDGTPISVALSFYLLLLVVAVHGSRTVYMHSSHPGFPSWLRPRAFAFSSEAQKNLCLRTSVLRAFFVYPAHTMYTRAQLLHVLATSLLISLLTIALFFGRENENCSNISNLISVFASLVASLVETSCRLAFRAANLRDPFFKALYQAHKQTRKRRQDQGLGHAEGNRPELAVDRVSASAPSLKLNMVSVELGCDPRCEGSRPATIRIGGPVPASAAYHRTVANHLAQRARVASPSAASPTWESVRLRSRQVVLETGDDDTVTVGFFWRPHDSKQPTFVPAALVHRPIGLLGSVVVTYRHDQLGPSIEDLPSPTSVVSRSGHEAAPLQGCCRCSSILAWAFNSAVLWGAGICLIVLAETRQLLPSQLRASALDDEEWFARIQSGFLLSIMNSMAILDLCKVVCLTLTTSPALKAIGMGKQVKWKTTKVLRRVLRRLHKVLDLVL